MNILLVDDHNLFAEGLKTLLYDFNPAPDVTVCESCESALQQADLEAIDLVLLDYKLSGVSGLDALHSLRQACTNALIAVVSALDDPAAIREIIDAGAAGFIPKKFTYAELSSALHVVLGGETYLPPLALEADNTSSNASADVIEGLSGLEGLSKRQRDVFNQVMQGKPNKVIADNLAISESTVKAHVSASFRLLGVKNRTEAVYAVGKLQAAAMRVPA